MELRLKSKSLLLAEVSEQLLIKESRNTKTKMPGSNQSMMPLLDKEEVPVMAEVLLMV